MATVVTINRPDVVALIEQAAEKLTACNKTEAVALAMRNLLERAERQGSLFGAHPGSVCVRADVDLIAPALDVEPDAESGREIARRARRCCSTRTSHCGSTTAAGAFGARRRRQSMAVGRRAARCC